jgi:predicted acyltransferase
MNEYLTLSAASSRPATRHVFIDAFRGLAMVLMLLVDVTEGKVAALAHSEWHGVKVADLAMPAFLFVTGASFGLSTKLVNLVDAWVRSVKLVIFGILIQGSWLPNEQTGVFGLDLANFRIPGILQRIGVVYFLLAVIVKYCRDVKRQTQIVCGAVLGNLLAMLLMAPCPGNVFTRSCNAASVFDAAVFGKHHLHRPEIPFDPEGMLSTLPCLFTAWIGLLYTRHNFGRSVGGVALIFLGVLFLLAGIPVNKALWTPSYNFITTGICVLICRGLERAETAKVIQPLIWLGANAILFFVASDCGGGGVALLRSFWVARPDRNVVTGVKRVLSAAIGSEGAGLLLYGLLELTIFFLILKRLYSKQIYIKM